MSVMFWTESVLNYLFTLDSETMKTILMNTLQVGTSCQKNAYHLRKTTLAALDP